MLQQLEKRLFPRLSREQRHREFCNWIIALSVTLFIIAIMSVLIVLVSRGNR